MEKPKIPRALVGKWTKRPRKTGEEDQIKDEEQHNETREKMESIPPTLRGHIVAQVMETLRKKSEQ